MNNVLRQLPFEWRSGNLLRDLQDWIASIECAGHYRHGGDLFSFITVREHDRMITRVEQVTSLLATLVNASLLIPSQRDENWQWVAMSRRVQAKYTSVTPGLNYDAVARSFTIASSDEAIAFWQWCKNEAGDALWERLQERKRAFLDWRIDYQWKVGY